MVKSGEMAKEKAPQARQRLPPPRGPGGLTPGRLLVEHELLGVDQGPEDVLVGGLLVLAVLGQVLKGRLQLVGGRLVGEGPQEQLLDYLLVGPLVLGQGVGPAAGTGQLALDLVGVEQVQRLGQVGLADALALTGADPLRPAEDVQEVGRV